MSRLTWDGTAELVSRDEYVRGAVYVGTGGGISARMEICTSTRGVVYMLARPFLLHARKMYPF